MATLLRITIPAPQDVLDTYGALAKYRIERDTAEAMTAASEITSGTVLADQTEYEVQDATGVDGTHWYRVRYSKATPVLSSDYSDYGAAFQAGAPRGEVVRLETVKAWMSISDTDDDGWLALAVQSMNRAVIRGIGVDIGPSPDTTRTYDARDATDSGRRLWVKGGIRAFTTVEVSTDGSTWTAVTTQVRIGPLVHERPYGEPGAYIELTPYLSGSIGSFLGYAYVRITGTAFQTFGWDAYPADLVQGAVRALKRMVQDRQHLTEYPSETNALRYLDARLLASYRHMYFSPAA